MTRRHRYQRWGRRWWSEWHGRGPFVKAGYFKRWDKKNCQHCGLSITSPLHRRLR